MTIKEGYEKLFDAVYENEKLRESFIDVEDENALCRFTAMVGKQYKDCCDAQHRPFRLMIVGRATNGWGEYEEVLQGKRYKAGFAESAVANFKNENKAVTQQGADRFEWIEPKGDSAINSLGTYQLTSSPFWRVSKEIWNRLSGRNEKWDDKWYEKIVWSNLYKLAPKSMGNPSGRLMNITSEACVEILQAEIQELRPTHIIFITGYDWFMSADYPSKECNEQMGRRWKCASFADIFINCEYLGKNVYRGNSKNGTFVEAMAEYQKSDEDNLIQVAITCRPEGRNEAAYIKDVVEKINRV